MPTDFNAQKGFTLIELMIALTLGLLISAAALMIFLSSQRSLAIQAGMGDIQQNTIFGLSALTHELRHANLDTGFDEVNANHNAAGIDFSRSGSTGIQGVMTTASDVLTIRYRARAGHNTDCSGNIVANDTSITHRYYIAELPANQQTGNVRRYGLMCQATHGVGAPLAPAIVIPDAESFKVSVLTRHFSTTTHNRADDLMEYQTLADYISTPRGDTVTALEIGVVLRSSNSVQADNKINQTTFNIAGQDVTLTASPDNNRFLRTPITQVVALRNAQGLK